VDEIAKFTPEEVTKYLPDRLELNLAAHDLNKNIASSHHLLLFLSLETQEPKTSNMKWPQIAIFGSLPILQAYSENKPLLMMASVFTTVTLLTFDCGGCSETKGPLLFSQIQDPF
jgi:hypothetical protein